MEEYTLPNLTELGLYENIIDTDICLVISKLLQKEETKLEDLELDYNKLGNEGAEILAKAL